MDDAARILAAEHAIAAAHLTLDTGVIEALYHPDFAIALPEGGYETRADVISSWQSGERFWSAASVDQLDVRLAGDTAVVFGRWRATGNNRGQAFDYAARFTSVWTRVGADWRNLAYHATEIDP